MSIEPSLGAMAGVGLETWVGEQWSVGRLVRIIYAKPKIDGNLPGSDINADWENTIIAPCLLFTATYH